MVSLLTRFGFRVELAPDVVSRRDELLDQIEANNAARRAADPKAPEVGIQSIPGYACYETVEETFAAAQGFASSKPQLASWLDAGDSWQKTTGSGGYDIGVLVLTNSAVPAPSPSCSSTAPSMPASTPPRRWCWSSRAGWSTAMASTPTPPGCSTTTRCT
jgi:hypothetical protein